MTPTTVTPGPIGRGTQWERMIDTLALHGINEVLVYMGAESVYLQTFEKFGYSREELRAWFPTPAHQPWWLLDNMSGWVGPSVAQHLIDDRLSLAAKITQRLRELGDDAGAPRLLRHCPGRLRVKESGCAHHGAG